jgi:hypothetical protein
MFAVKRYAGDARPCHRRHLRRRRTLKVSHHLDARDVRGFYLVRLQGFASPAFGYAVAADVKDASGTSSA